MSRWWLVMLVLVVVAAPGLAQSNSLLHALRRARPEAAEVATTQPARGIPLGAALFERTALTAGPTEAPPVNEVLMGVSPFAVAAPQPQTFAVHDLVTIIIRESRSSLNDAKLTSEKDWEVQSELARWFKLDGNGNLEAQIFDENPGIDFRFENSYEGKGKYDRKDELTTRLTAAVIDIKPNGNLVLEARKRIRTGDEEVVATLTGECRSADVTPDNTVLSTQIANLEIEMPDLGAVRDATRRGWLMRLFDLLRPI